LISISLLAFTKGRTELATNFMTTLPRPLE